MAIIPVLSTYTIRVRKPGFILADQIANFKKFSIVRLFNAVGTWAIELDASDPVADLLTTPGYGIQALRTLTNANTGQVLASTIETSGPMTGVTRQMANNGLIISGRDDLVYVASRLMSPDAFSVATYSVEVISTAPLRYYRLADTSPSTALDNGSQAHNGTYFGNITYNADGAVGDTNNAAGFDGTNAYVSVPMTSLPSGAVSAGIGAWVCPTAVPASGNATIAWWGSVTGHSSIALKITANPASSASALVFFDSAGVSTSKFAIPMNSYSFVSGDWDAAGLNQRLYINGVLMNIHAQSTITIGTVTSNIGQYNGSEFFTGYIDEVVYYSGVPGATVWAALYAAAFGRYAALAYDNATGDGETVIRGYVTRNMITAGETNRNYPWLTQTTNNHAGSTVTGNARFDQPILADGTGLLQQLALAAGGLGIRTLPTPGGLLFDVYVPVDRSTTVRFSQALGSVLDFQYTKFAPAPESSGNAYTVGGGGLLTARAMVDVSDPTSETLWWRMEQFLDATDTSDYPTMIQRGYVQLNTNRQMTTFTATLAQTPSAVYGLDFFLGDNVTTIVDGQLFSSQVLEVDIDLTNQSRETITPIVGTPNADLVDDAIESLRRKGANTAARVAALERRK